MTPMEKESIIRMRNEGCGYSRIARELGLNENTVKTFCRRNKETAQNLCLCCGKPVTQNPGRKQKKFCNDVCRQKYWNAHLNDVRRKSMNGLVCAECGKTFYAYGYRKYCCHKCYITDRFGGAE